VPSQVFIPPLLIQPVIQFFIWNRVSEQHLTKIKLQIDVNELVVIKVCCNGTITNEALEEDEGVKNVKERLQLLESYTGNSYAFNLTCDTYGEGNWETVELKVPIEWGQS
jgi:LytS/YehU family sensor histidine kinase